LGKLICGINIANRPQLVNYLVTATMLVFVEMIMLIVCFRGRGAICVEYLLFEGSIIRLPLVLCFDWISYLFRFSVILITFRVIIYCWSYMRHELNHWRFIRLVLLFVSRILILIIGANISTLVLDSESSLLKILALGVRETRFQRHWRRVRLTDLDNLVK
jgi:NADH:ubiquinone oxidoreductase subunit 5 (subunit L)/multisubunit Na+/H+ antiporter MnhA subunit